MGHPGFPTTERCPHGAGPGCICEMCAGPVNLPLDIAMVAKETMQMAQGHGGDMLERAVKVHAKMVNWATDRRNCFKDIGPCACEECAP